MTARSSTHARKSQHSAHNLDLIQTNSKQNTEIRRSHESMDAKTEEIERADSLRNVRSRREESRSDSITRSAQITIQCRLNSEFSDFSINYTHTARCVTASSSPQTHTMIARAHTHGERRRPARESDFRSGGV